MIEAIFHANDTTGKLFEQCSHRIVTIEKSKSGMINVALGKWKRKRKRKIVKLW